MNREHRLRLTPVLCIAAAVGLLIGCDRDPMVRVYEVDAGKPAQAPDSGPAAAGTADSQAAPKRMLGAIIPTDESMVFLKITGEPAALEKHREAVESMASSLRLNGPNQVEFDVPEGWQRTAGGGFAAAKVNPPEMQGIDGPLTVTILSQPQDLQSNLDRWRGQLGLPPVPVEQEDPSNVRTIPGTASDQPIYLVDYVGIGSGSMRPPMMSSVPPATAADPAAAGEAADRAIAAESPAVAAEVTVPAVSQQEKSNVEYDLPEEWVDVGADSQSIRLVSLKTGPDPQAADVSFVMAGGEDASIVELWAAAVFGDAQPSREQIDAILEDAGEVTAANGVKGKLYFVAVPAHESDQTATHANDPTILGVIFEAQEPSGDEAAGGRRGFVKMTGPRGEVEANRSKFRSFVESLRW